jgi:hypothetical protein
VLSQKKFKLESKIIKTLTLSNSINSNIYKEKRIRSITSIYNLFFVELMELQGANGVSGVPWS